MRHLAPLVVATVAICSPSQAFAAEHLMHVSEVMLSNNNDTNIRFIELADPALEPFPSTYRLRVYNAVGTMVDTVTLTVAPDTQRMLIGTAQADAMFGTTRDATLAMPLPVDGQACFENATANIKIHCLAWGCVTTLVDAGAQRGATPPTGQSLQRQGNGMYQLAAPTPDAANAAGSAAAACPTQDGAPMVVDGPVTMDSGLPPLDSLGGPDAGGGNNNNGDDEGGCCQVEGSRGAAGAVLLALGVLLTLRASRRKRSR